MLEPCLGAIHKVEWQVLDDEEVIVCPACSTRKAKVFQPYSGVVSLEYLMIFDDAWKRVGNGV